MPMGSVDLAPQPPVSKTAQKEGKINKVSLQIVLHYFASSLLTYQPLAPQSFLKMRREILSRTQQTPTHFLLRAFTYPQVKPPTPPPTP